MMELASVGVFDRRQFAQVMSGGLLVLLTSGGQISGQESGGPRRGQNSRDSLPQNVDAWIRIDQDGSVTAFTGKVEVGQNIRTSLTQAIADELHCEPDSIQLVMGDTDLTPFDFGTVGSRTTPGMAPQLRRMAATMREQLLRSAAEKWGVAPTNLEAKNGWVSESGSGRRVAWGELARAMNWTRVLGRDDLAMGAEKWEYSGKSLPKVDAKAFVTGKHKYSSDFRRPNMVYGRVFRPPSFNATLQEFDGSAALKIRGVTVVREGDFAGVTAPDELTAEKALRALKAKWNQQKQIARSELYEYLKANVTGDSERNNGPLLSHGGVPASGAKRIESRYTVAYIAHVPLEPRTAVAEWNGPKLTVWTGTQRPFGVRSELAEAFRIPEQQVRVIVPDTGSAYGGKHTGECAVEAARLAKAAGRPVKLMWTREEEFTWAYFRPAGVIDVAGEVAKDGTIESWEFVNYNSGPSGLRSPYRSSTSNVRFVKTKYPLRQGSYRGLAATANHFARESYIDELAHAAGLDPLDLRLKNLNEPRVRAVLEAAAQRFGWQGGKPAKNCGRGMACGMEKGSFFACCAEISVSPQREIRVRRVVEAFECGAIVNPEHLRNQVEGAIVMGLGGALFEEIDFANGCVLNAHLAKYRVPRFSDVPAIDLVLVDRRDLPSVGAGETPIMGIAAAIANALFDATKVRVRQMPIEPAFRAART